METKKHSARFETLLERYGRGGCTKRQLRRFVQLKALTEAEYEEITEETYDSAGE